MKKITRKQAIQELKSWFLGKVDNSGLLDSEDQDEHDEQLQEWLAMKERSNRVSPEEPQPEWTVEAYCLKVQELFDKRQLYWHSQKGVILVNDMDSKHIRNCIVFISRNSNSLFECFGVDADVAAAKWTEIFNTVLRRRISHFKYGSDDFSADLPF